MAAKKTDTNTTKHYVLDTNVLIHDPQSMLSFEENAVWIPVEVLEELDRFKSESTTRGANAREVHRRLSERFRTTAQMQQGVVLENRGRLHICINPQVKFDDHGWHLISESPQKTAPPRETKQLFDQHNQSNAGSTMKDESKPIDKPK